MALTASAEQPLRATGQGVHAPVLPGRPCHGDIRSAARSHARALHGRWDRHAPGMPMCERLNHALPEPPRDKKHAVGKRCVRQTRVAPPKRWKGPISKQPTPRGIPLQSNRSVFWLAVIPHTRPSQVTYPVASTCGGQAYSSGGCAGMLPTRRRRSPDFPFHPAWACAMPGSCSKRKL